MQFEKFVEKHKDGITLEDFIEALREGIVNDDIFLKTFCNGYFKKGNSWIPCISFINAVPISDDYVVHAYVGKGTVKWLTKEQFKKEKE